MENFIPTLPMAPGIRQASGVASEALGQGALVALYRRLTGAFAEPQVSQSRVAVNGNNVTLVSAAPPGVAYREIMIQNLGTYPLFLELSSGAANTGASGEIVLNAGGAGNDGTGGVYRVAGFLGTISGASAGALNAAVVVTTLQ